MTIMGSKGALLPVGEGMSTAAMTLLEERKWLGPNYSARDNYRLGKDGEKDDTSRHVPDCEAAYIVDVIAARGWLRVPCATTDRKKAKKRHLTEGMTEETLTDHTTLRKKSQFIRKNRRFTMKWNCEI